MAADLDIQRNRLEIGLLGGGQQLLGSEEHTSELQSLRHLVCRLLLEKKKRTNERPPPSSASPRTPMHRPRPSAATSSAAVDLVRPSHGGFSLQPCVRVFFFLMNRPPPRFTPFPHRALLRS